MDQEPERERRAEREQIDHATPHRPSIEKHRVREKNTEGR
jgi:hypothetical protein